MPARSITPAVKFIYRTASPDRRREFVGTLLIMLLGGAAELLTIGAVVPFLALVSDPARAIQMPFLRWLIGLLGNPDADDLILIMAATLTGAAVVAGSIRLLLTWKSLKFVLNFGHEMGTQLYSRMLRQPYRHYVMQNTSGFIAGMEKLQAVVYSVLLPVMQGFTASVIAVLITALLIYIDATTAIIAAAAMLLTYLGVSILSRRKLRSASQVWAESATARVKSIQEGMGGIRDILLDQSQPVFEEAFARVDLRYRRAQMVSNFIAIAPRYIVETAAIVLIAAVAVYFSNRPGGLVAAIPVLGALAVGAQRLLPLLQLSYNSWSSLMSNHQMLIDVVDLLQTPIVETAPRPHAEAIRPFRNDIMLDRIGFRYADDKVALHDVSMRIAKGDRIGICGKTGSGKSTLVDIIMGLLEPTGGSIRIDGEPLGAETLANWQAQVAHVPQMIYLSDSSIAANIAFGEAANAIDLDRVRGAARQAEIDDFIGGLPEGYATPVGERGIRLSGGQRQRLGIARALYKGANVLIFDEATSALDTGTEAAIMDSINRLPQDVTMILIAHRTATLAGCNRIIELDGGRVAATRSRDELSSAFGP